MLVPVLVFKLVVGICGGMDVGTRKERGAWRLGWLKTFSIFFSRLKTASLNFDPLKVLLRLFFNFL